MPSLLDNEPDEEDEIDETGGDRKTLDFLLRQVFGHLTYNDAIASDVFVVFLFTTWIFFSLVSKLTFIIHTHWIVQNKCVLTTLRFSLRAAVMMMMMMILPLLLSQVDALNCFKY
jgi:hypothetical protein